MNEQYERKIIDKVTVPIEQTLNNLELLEIADDPEVIKSIIADSKAKLNRAKAEYIKELK